MFCPKCGDPIEPNEKFCNKCGNCLININNNYKTKNNKKNAIIIGVGVGVVILIFTLTIALISINSKEEYYFSEKPTEEEKKPIEEKKEEKKSKGKYSTVIVADNEYYGVSVKNIKDANELIIQDSVSQKDACPSEIKKIEDEIINNYGVTAVNLCEVEVGFAKEIANVFKVIYEEYPMAKEDLTNLTLINASISDGYIAAFQPAFPFAYSDDSNDTMVVKTQILLNTKYFLNKDKLQSSVTSASKSGHFPKNTTPYSPVAHEIGHYLSYLAMMKNYDVDSTLIIDYNNEDDLYDLLIDFSDGAFSLKMIEEAYDNYKKEVGTDLTLDEWRGTISEYALAKDNNGNYIYDETIAEGFHDVYLNGDDAVDASKYVVAVLKEKLKG